MLRTIFLTLVLAFAATSAYAQETGDGLEDTHIEDAPLGVMNPDQQFFEEDQNMLTEAESDAMLADLEAEAFASEEKLALEEMMNEEELAAARQEEERRFEEEREQGEREEEERAQEAWHVQEEF